MESFGENIKTTNDKFPYVKLNNIIKTLIGEIRSEFLFCVKQILKGNRQINPRLETYYEPCEN